jgi:hypothetical protein
MMKNLNETMGSQEVEAKEIRGWRKRSRQCLYKSVDKQDKVHLPTIRVKLTPLLGYPIGGSWPEA